MGTFDIESLLHEVTPGARCGDDISRGKEFLELEALVRPKPPGAVQTDEEVQVVEPNWTEVRQRAYTLLQRSRHLQVALYFSLALLATEGIGGLRDGLYLIRGLLERFWDDLHPRLDPEDDNDPTERISILMPLSREPLGKWDPVRFGSRLCRLPLCDSPRVGKFSLRDVEAAVGEKMTAEKDRQAPQLSVIEAAFRDTPVDEVHKTHEAARQAMEHLDGIRDVFQERARGGSGPDLSGLRGDIERICRVLTKYAGNDDASGEVTAPEAAVSVTTETGPIGAAVRIQSRNDALAAMERACQYFERHEPSSPIPLLLRRAQRLAAKTFLEIIEDVCPSGLDQVTAVGGRPEGDAKTTS
ncbi:MAG: type VI secretion system protein TssA [Sedimentisphaerales bacterium]|nr:type VI secretion system protein TssA [Sedimentisphaerales bacterium]